MVYMPRRSQKTPRLRQKLTAVLRQAAGPASQLGLARQGMLLDLKCSLDHGSDCGT
jgi:hypothetical protein